MNKIWQQETGTFLAVWFLATIFLSSISSLRLFLRDVLRDWVGSASLVATAVLTILLRRELFFTFKLVISTLTDTFSTSSSGPAVGGTTTVPLELLGLRFGWATSFLPSWASAAEEAFAIASDVIEDLVLRSVGANFVGLDATDAFDLDVWFAAERKGCCPDSVEPFFDLVLIGRAVFDGWTKGCLVACLGPAILEAFPPFYK